MTADVCVAGNSIVMFCGQLITGASASLTVTVNEHVDVLADTSRAVQLTVAVPSAKVEPEGGKQMTSATPQASVAVA